MSRGRFFQRVIACVLLLLIFLVANTSRAAAELKLSRSVWDLGNVEQGETKTQKILIANSGDEAVKIDKVELPEGLTMAPGLNDTEIEPQKELEVEFRFDSEKILGKLQQYAYIFPAGSDEKGILTLTIKGEVFEKGKPRLRVTPQTWNLLTVPMGTSRKGQFTCENAGTADLTIEEILLHDARFKIDSKRIAEITQKPIEPGGKVEFGVDFNPTYPGKCDVDFYIKSNSAGSSFTKVSIEGYAISRPRGVVISSTLSSVTNNALSTVEVTRTDKEGKSQTITVGRNATKAFVQEPGESPRPVSPTDYTLTVKLIRPTPPPRPAPPKPTEEKPEETEAERKPDEEESPEVTAPPPTLPEVEPAKPAVPETPEVEKPALPKPGESEPSGAEPPSTEKPSEAQPEKTEPSEEAKPAEGEKPATPEAEKKPEKPAEEQKPAAPSESEKKVEGPPAEPPAAPKEGEESKPPEGEASAPPAEPEKPSSPEEPPKDEEKKPPESE